MSCLNSGTEAPGGEEEERSPISFRAGSPGLTASVKQTMSYGGCSVSPRNSYQRIDVDTQGHNERVSSSASMASGGGKKFACHFDPNAKSGRILVLRFDTQGVGTFLEMTRADLLHMTHEAAKAKPQEGVEVESQADSPPTNGINFHFPSMRRPSMRRVVFDGPLNVSGVPDSISVAAVCDVQRVHARDIRKLDNAFSVSNEPSIVIRKQAVLISADPLRAIVMRDACLVFVPDGADGLLTILREKFRETARQDANMAYEFKALEALLATLCRYFETDYENTAPIVSAALDSLATGKMQMGELETLREFKNSMNEFESQVDRVRRVLMDLLDKEEDLRLLYLTKLHDNPLLLKDLWSYDSEEAEVLIENYLQDIFSTRTKAGLMLYRIQNTESLVMLKLDSMRNYLLGVDLIFSLVAISLSIGTFVTGAFGMNLDSHLQTTPGWFWSVVAATIVVFIALTGFGIIYFRRQGVLLSRTVQHPSKHA